jgi:hypothetical protein
MSKPHLAAVATLYETNASDIAGMLRQCADSIDAGANPQSIIAIATEDDGSLTIYGWGATNSMDALATLQLAVHKQARMMLGGDE